MKKSVLEGTDALARPLADTLGIHPADPFFGDDVDEFHFTSGDAGWKGGELSFDMTETARSVLHDLQDRIFASWDIRSGGQSSQRAGDDEGHDEESDLLAGAKPDQAGGGGKAHGKYKTKPSGSDTTTSDGSTTGGTDWTSSGGTDTSSGGTNTGGTETNTGSSDPNTYVSGLDTPQGFNIEVTFSGDWSTAMKQAICDAVERISDYVVGDLPGVNGIDDLHIDASMGSLNGYWGIGGYTSARSGSYLPSSGYLKLDSSGAASALNGGILDDLAFHEILHAMGFGLNWNSLGLVKDYNGDLRFAGANATQAYHDNFASIAADDPLSKYGVPIETDGGSGTAGKHWDDATFGNEIMTGQLDWSMKITDMTIAALQDMGYDTVYGDALWVA